MIRTKSTNRYNFNEIVKAVQDHCVEKEISVPRWRKNINEEESLSFHANVLRAMKELGFQILDGDRQEVAQEVAKRIVGMGVLQPYLELDGVEEVIVRNGFVQIERFGQIIDEGYLASDEYFYRLARRIADLEGKKLGAEEPKIKVGLPDGSRFTSTIPPLSHSGTAINIRRFSLRKLTFDDLVKRNTIDEETVDFLVDVAHGMQHSVVFSGRPGAGKTTMLNAFSRHLPPYAQVSTIETFEELQLQVQHLHHLVVEENPEAMADAINTTILRMRPDVLVVGEVVSKEAVEYILALNLGIVAHCTTHSKSARLGPIRLESLARDSGIPQDELREVIGAGLNLVVHLDKEWDEERKTYRRFMRELLAIKGVNASGKYVTETLKRWDGEAFTPLRGGREIWQH
ncbi:MAG: CpaF family protein [Chloroflexi bacterium]|nr:CpaF family protein [Chloroflexota bacterium]